MQTLNHLKSDQKYTKSLKILFIFSYSGKKNLQKIPFLFMLILSYIILLILSYENYDTCFRIFEALPVPNGTSQYCKCTLIIAIAMHLHNAHDAVVLCRNFNSQSGGTREALCLRFRIKFSYFFLNAKFVFSFIFS